MSSHCSANTAPADAEVAISVVVPVYGCPSALPELHRRLTQTLAELVDTYEIILVDDRCPMGSWEGVKSLAQADSHVVGVHLARNSGQSCAITAGLDLARGSWAVVMDCDCQDPPEDIPILYHKATEGYDVVFARRVGRKDSRLTLGLSHAFYRTFSFLVEAKIDPTIGNFSIASRRAYKAYTSMREHGRDYSLFMTWIGFEQATVDIVPEERFEGKSSYTFGKKIALATETITTHSTKPLLLSVQLGFLISLAAFFVLVWLVINSLVSSDIPMGWPSTVASIFLMGGLTISAIGMVGIYVANTFVESRNRPLYLVQDVVRSDEANEDANESGQPCPW